jgi:hypothetical protein
MGNHHTNRFRILSIDGKELLDTEPVNSRRRRRFTSFVMPV